MPAIGPFSNPPMIDHLATLTLSAEDVNHLSECRAGDCGLKLADAEIRRMQAALATGKVNDRSTVERTFREILFERVWTYLDGGLRALPPFHDNNWPVDVAEAFGRLVERSVYLDRVPPLKASLGGPPVNGVTASYVYWSIEDFGRKQVIRVTHVGDRPARHGRSAGCSCRLDTNIREPLHRCRARGDNSGARCRGCRLPRLSVSSAGRCARKCSRSWNRNETHRRRRRTTLRSSAQASSGRLRL